jgi:hypothetical protein
MIDQFPHAPRAVFNALEVAEACLSNWEPSLSGHYGGVQAAVWDDHPGGERAGGT